MSSVTFFSVSLCEVVYYIHTKHAGGKHRKFWRDTFEGFAVPGDDIVEVVLLVIVATVELPQLSPRKERMRH